ncbi:MAG TPA: amino acid adenylation domain-containing protein [Thermoanaerobaculia bacterium]|nr:amino acid adenylation domain-containing protein [Thermoanaerobaculia bacterium]
MTEHELAQRLAELPLEQRALLFKQLQARKKSDSTPQAPPLVRQPRTGDSFPLSFAQQRLYFLNQYEPDSPEYNIPYGFLMHGPLHADVLRQAFDGVLARHETLRTTFKIIDGTPMQIVAENGAVGMPLVDLRSRPREERGAEAMRQASADAGAPFDLMRGPLLRAKLFRLEGEEHLLYLNVHHIAWDGWSQGVFLSELRVLYDTYFAGDPSPLPELEIQYLDFALWQRGWLQGEILARQLSYWRNQLAGTPPLELPCDSPRPAIRTHSGTAAPISLNKDLAATLRRLAQQEGATPFMLYAAAYRALLHHYTAQDDFAIGTLIANRRRPEVERMIGFFANTLALRTDLSGDPTFLELLRRERNTALDAYAHQDLPFEKLMEELNPPRDLSRTAVFQTMLILQNAPPAREDGRSGLSMLPVPVDSRTSKFDCMLYLTEWEEGVRGFLEYNTGLFEAATVTRLLGHLHALLEGVAANPELRLSELPLLRADEQRTMLADWNATAAELPAGETLHGLFEQRVRENPEAIALEMAEERMTYAELDRRANQLARYLRRLGVGPEVLVGLAIERSLDLVVGLLGILKSGGAYVPLDPEYPRERLAYMIGSSGLPVLVTQEKLVASLPESAASVVALDRAWPEIAAEEASALEGGAGPDNVAYVVYTSGSTGQPKGVQIPHSAVVNFLRSMSKKPGLGSGDTLFAVTTLSFDIAGLELYLPLVNGGKVALVSREVAQAGEELAAAISRAGTTVMQATPATWRLLLGAGWEGNPCLKVLCGGEALPRDLADQILERAGELWNVYGPTEATIWSTLLQVEKSSRIAIGRPIDNTQVYLLTRQLQPVPVGVPGELHIGGAGLSRGYRARPDLTAERFIPNPFAEEPGARVYKTGDLARWLPDGTLEFLGRIDHQVKVRGYRIELGEIEAALGQHPGLSQAVAIVREDSPGSKRIVAYMVPAQEAPQVSDLRAFLKEKLPEYMIPALFVPLEALPLTPNGKVDRRALPAPDKSLLASAREYVAPRDEKEETLAAIWAEVLGLEKVGALDDFFELGGDSLLAIKVVSKANKANVGITTKQLFQHRTLGELAAVAGTSTVLAEQGPVIGPVRFTPAQVHFLEFGHPNPSFHSLGNLLRPRDRKLNREALRQALLAVVNQHDNLRCRLEMEAGNDSGSWKLVCDEPRKEYLLPVVDVSEAAQDIQGKVMREAVIQLIKSQRMEEGKLVKVLVFELGGDEGDAFYLNIQFMAADIGSWTVLLDDLDTVYRQLCAGEPVALQPKTTSARQWADKLAERASEMPPEERAYWLNRAPWQDEPLPRDFAEGSNFWDSVRQLRFDMTEEESRLLLREVPRAYGVQIDGILMTALMLAFERWTGRRAMGFQTVGNGKEPLWDDVDLTRTVGWFNIIFPERLDLGDSKTPIEALRLVNQQLRRIPNGGLGYGLLRYMCDDLEIQRKMKAWPYPELFFNYVGPDVASEVKAFENVTHFHGYPQDTSTRRITPFMIGGHVQDGILFLKWDFSKNLHRQETVENLMSDTQEILRAFLADYQARKNRAS